MKATNEGLLSAVSQCADRMRTSFYADNAAIFLYQVKEEIEMLLDFFGKISGHSINLSKCTAYPVQCEHLDMTNLISSRGCNLGSLPCSYLGLPLSFRNPTRAVCQALIEKVASKLKPWKGKLLSRKGHLTLVNSVLSATMTYFLTIFDPPVWLIKKIDRIKKKILWCGD